jgi:hypothetical protein
MTTVAEAVQTPILEGIPEDLHSKRDILPDSGFAGSLSGFLPFGWETIKIRVTEADIKTAVRGDSNACAIVQAAERAGVRLRIGQDGNAQVFDRGEWQTLCGTRRFGKWVRDFDAGRPVEPFEVSYSRPRREVSPG